MGADVRHLFGVVVGRRTFNKVNEVVFRKGVLIFLFLVAAVGLVFN